MLISAAYESYEFLDRESLSLRERPTNVVFMYWTDGQIRVHRTLVQW